MAEANQNEDVFQLCKSFIHVNRTENSGKSEMGTSAINQIENYFRDDNERLAIYHNILIGLDHINLSYIKDNKAPLLHADGSFDMNVFKRLKIQLQDVIEDMMDESEVFPKWVNNTGSWVTLETMIGFIEKTVRDLKAYQSTELYVNLIKDLRKCDSNERGE